MKSILLIPTLLLTTFTARCCGTHCNVPTFKDVSQEEGLNVLKNIGECMPNEVTEHPISCTFELDVSTDKSYTAKGEFSINPQEHEYYFYMVSTQQSGLNMVTSTFYYANNNNKSYEIVKEGTEFQKYNTEEFDSKEESFNYFYDSDAFIYYTISILPGLQYPANNVYDIYQELLTGVDKNGDKIDEEDRSTLVSSRFQTTGEPGTLIIDFTYLTKSGVQNSYYLEYINYYAKSILIEKYGTSTSFSYDFNAKITPRAIPAQNN